MQPSIFSNILANLEKVIHGKTEILKKFLICYFAGGHILLEDVPGVGKTTLAKALAFSIQCQFHRIQFTPDLMPADITGSMIYNSKSGEFQFRPGPIFSDILLADEINRASPRTQSALLEAMNESQVSIEGVAQTISPIFTVIATQNPVAFHGTYPLPEAQIDRFYISLTLGYPSRKDEQLMLISQQYQHPLEQLKSVTNMETIASTRKMIRNIMVNEAVLSYLLEIVENTRHDPRIRLGISPRGSLALYRMAQSHAWVNGRDFVIPDDIKQMAAITLSHRLLQSTKIRNSGIRNEEIIHQILSQIKIPTI